MSTIELVVCLNNWQYLLKTTTNETLTDIKNKIKSRSGIDANSEDYVLEVYDADLGGYVVLTTQYLEELKNDLSTMPIPRLEIQVKPRRQKGTIDYE
ncbi:unnamed protein product [Adineta steineri]|uniref:Ubiquitin-like domain-containing protein n=1 Tax=Adineta steineri TaxID=433720 RepID=A0A814FC70_9BILA|nr:unnamed protein product [Adineta steineri]CAF1050942.1 unnamed protein product [Adineta steineri]CAF3901838.1 unnamed protein product [Adineta steineri]CAF4119143.1 unnamed protein product [Adineta steineri]